MPLIKTVKYARSCSFNRIGKGFKLFPFCRIHCPWMHRSLSSPSQLQTVADRTRSLYWILYQRRIRNVSLKQFTDAHHHYRGVLISLCKWLSLNRPPAVIFLHRLFFTSCTQRTSKYRGSSVRWTDNTIIQIHTHTHTHTESAPP
jgi:hypothetical protein